MELPKRHQVAEVASPPVPWAEACHPSVPRVIPLNSMLSEDQSIFFQVSDTQGPTASLIEPIAQTLLLSASCAYLLRVEIDESAHDDW